MSIRVMVVDDHPIWREGVARDLAERGLDVAILDARRLADGPVATLHLQTNTGITFHGTWRPGT